LSETPKLVLESDVDTEPTAEQSYGFWGLTKQTFDGSSVRHVPKLESGLTFTRSEGDYHIFATKTPYRSYKEYEGCSGAPILDADGRLVALVVEGNKRKTAILGLNLSRYRVVLDAHLLSVGG